MGRHLEYTGHEMQRSVVLAFLFGLIFGIGVMLMMG
jgi:hypothetical protein